MTHHGAKQDDSVCAGDHYRIAVKLSVSRSCELQFQEEELNLEKKKKTYEILQEELVTGVKLTKAKKRNLVVRQSNGHGTSHQPGPPYYDLLKNSVKIILLKK